MTKLLRAGLVALLGFAVATPAALASKVVAHPEKGQMTVDDASGVFHPDAVIKSEAKFNGVTFKSATHVKVKTFDKVPKERKADYDAAVKASTKENGTPKRNFMRAWAQELAGAETDHGVFVLVCTEAKSVEVVSDKRADLYQHFGDDKCKTMAERIATGFREAEKKVTEDEKRAARGDGLVAGTEYLISQVKNAKAPDPTATGGTHSAGDTHETKKSGGMHWIWWVLIVIGVLLVIWIIVAIIRALSGVGSVYGPGYGGYGYGGGGGGGFFPCFLGGMFGAMAGMWMYNSMFGGHMYYDQGAAAAGVYPDTGTTDPGAGDYDNGGAGGADWGDDAGGGDAGGGDAGGADWGNDGGDAGGGGDWGGDGGGGDWGGGDAGGGDFGGGGGDW